MPRRNERRDALSILLALAGLYWFASSFFLAKRTLSDVSSCDEGSFLLTNVLGMTTSQVEQLEQRNLLSLSDQPSRNGCWTTRGVDSLIILLVDALRFDFCLYSLPESVGARLQQNHTRLFRFVADPPTVTMQRLKALTTGGLPTFADISANFGGASVEEDSWVTLLNAVDAKKRGMASSKAAFVGDDTWHDLYPNEFTESYPYPSFNTRDLDTVDDGCLLHLPNLTQRLRPTTSTRNDDELEVVVVHFLGVDHVGHTYGPHNQHMDAKLKQMDKALAGVLDRMDRETACRAALIFGDHGMTEDGNHGGGTPEEVSAALFVHVSPSCGELADEITLESEYRDVMTSSNPLWNQFQPYASIHQIDLVPTLSLLLGLPIPYSNLGGVVPSLLPGQTRAETATILALNSAQIWRYYKHYSTLNKLPLGELEKHLYTAVATFQEALEKDNDEIFHQSAALFKHFLAKALELGQRVWTRFDIPGMIGGILVLAGALIVYSLPLMGAPSIPMSHTWETALTVMFMFFQCVLLTFSNSYILEESHFLMYALTLLSLAVSFRLCEEPSTMWRGVLLLPFIARICQVFVSGHGDDPSLRKHSAHHTAIFLTSLFLLGSFRWTLSQRRVGSSWQAIVDCLVLVCLADSWYEKRSARNGFVPCRVAITLLVGSLCLALFHALINPSTRKSKTTSIERSEGHWITLLTKLLLAVMTVTGPSTAATLVAYSVQVTVLYFLSAKQYKVHSLVLAALVKLVTRLAFFSTNHGCFFNRLQYSAAFIATTEFYFVSGGVSLFLNTFGWELAGILFAWILSRRQGQGNLWRIYIAFQLLEALSSCLSVSVLKRHLMVWDIYAPHFLFTAIFTVLAGLSELTAFVLSD